jgi:2-dehydro-3-deoxygluconokinase
VVGAVGEGLLEIGLDPSLPDDRLRRGFGGDAANAAVMAARLGARTRLLSRVGDDAAGRMLMDFWARAGLDLTWVETDDQAATGLYVNERDALGEHRFSYHRRGSAASRLQARAAEPAFLNGLAALHYTGISLAVSDSAAEAAEVAAERARAAGALLSFTVNFRERLAPDRERLVAAARGADLLFLSVHDAQALLGAERIEDVARALAPAPPEIVMTFGPEPARLLTAGGQHAVTPPRVQVVDTAGAGDAVAGAYLALRLAGASPPAALAHGVVAASLSCRGEGCARSYPGAPEVRAALSAGESEPAVPA